RLHPMHPLFEGSDAPSPPSLHQKSHRPEPDNGARAADHLRFEAMAAADENPRKAATLAHTHGKAIQLPAHPIARLKLFDDELESLFFRGESRIQGHVQTLSRLPQPRRPHRRATGTFGLSRPVRFGAGDEPFGAGFASLSTLPQAAGFET